MVGSILRLLKVENKQLGEVIMNALLRVEELEKEVELIEMGGSYSD